MTEDTIFAVASGAGRAAIAVMRISGPESSAILASLCGRLPSPRRSVLRRLKNRSGVLLDQAMVVWLPQPRSYTGEDSVELYLHGGRAVTNGVAGELVTLGARPAEPGEFTRRAFVNGRMDLTEAEAVHDLVCAETEAQRLQALRQLEGALSSLYGGWAHRLTTLLAQQEALIDFPDEDLPPEISGRLRQELGALETEIAAHLTDNGRGEKLREGLVFAITGPPNVGKSSLMNALAMRDVALVSAIPGTTRDALESRIDFGGVPVTLVDTAGLRETEDFLEAEGVRRARARAESADLVIAVFEAGGSTAPCHPKPGELPQELPGELFVANKCDLGGRVPDGALPVSALTGEGLPLLRQRLTEIAQDVAGLGGPPPLTQARHRAALNEALRHLNAAAAAALPELQGEDLRLALRSLSRITGSIGVEEILDVLFSQFCIGK